MSVLNTQIGYRAPGHHRRTPPDRAGHRRLRLRGMIVLLLLCLPGTLAPESGAEEGPRIELHASADLRELFTPLAAPTGEARAGISHAELADFFARMSRAGDEYCAMLYGQARFNRERAAELIRPERLDEFRKRHRSDYLSRLVAGCWNFFIMNDVRPFLDFELIRALYARDTYDCYSVGFMQPYIMHNLLGCQSLTMLDIDWRIHAAHFQLLTLYNQSRMRTRPLILESIATLDLAWIAFAAGPPRARHTVGLETLCRSYRPICLEHLLRFQAKIRELPGVRLELTALHDGEYTPSGRASLQVVYLSNAVEDVYTSPDQFDRLLAGVAGGRAATGLRTLFVYHAAGTRALGLYELGPADAASPTPRLQTICKDTYQTWVDGTLHEYRTHFERKTETRRPPTCQALLKRARLI